MASVAEQIRAESERRKAEAVEQQQILDQPGPTTAKADLTEQIRVEKLKRQMLSERADVADKMGATGIPDIGPSPAFQHGATFGLDVPLSGLASGLNFFRDDDSTFSERYQAGEAARRAELERYGAEGPVPVAQELVGTVLSGGAGGAAERALAERGGQAVAPIVSKGLTRTAAESALLGGGTGFAHGISTGEGDLGDRALQGAKEGIFGGGIGFGLTGASGVFGKNLDIFLANPSVRARQALYEIGRREGLTPQSVDDLITRYGPETMALDVSEAARGAGRTAANVSPEARETLVGATTGRQQGQNIRLAADYQTASGLQPGDRRTVQDIVDQSYEARRPAIDAAYDAARAAGQELPDEPFRQILETPMGRAAYDAAGPSLLNRGAIEGNEGGIRGALARLDQTKRELDGIGEQARRAGDNNRAAQAEGLAALLRQRIDETLQDPIYAEARALRQAAFREQEAIETGADIAGRGNMGGPAAAAQFSGDPSQLAGLRAGYGQQTAENLLTSQPGGALNPLTTPLATETRASVLGADAPTIENAIERERLFNRGNTAVTGNSSTVRQMVEAGLGGGGLTAGLAAIAGMPLSSLTVPALGMAALSAGGRAIMPAIRSRLSTGPMRDTQAILGQLLTQSPRNIPFVPAIAPIAQNALSGLGTKLGPGINSFLSGLIKSSEPPVPVEPPDQRSELENDYPIPVELTDPRDILRRRGLSYG